jgi:ComF family protein
MELLDLLLPSGCALCGLSGPPICRNCENNFSARDFDIRRKTLSGFAATSYSEEAAKLIFEFKERGQTSLAKYFASLIAPRLTSLKQINAILVPVPSAKRTTATRGFQPAQVIARQLSKQCGLANFSAIKPVAEIADQAALTREQRATNVMHSMQASEAIRGKSVILVDDIVTTGATLNEAARAVTQAGGLPIFFVTFAETIRKIGNGFAN